MEGKDAPVSLRQVWRRDAGRLPWRHRQLQLERRNKELPDSQPHIHGCLRDASARLYWRRLRPGWQTLRHTPLRHAKTAVSRRPRRECNRAYAYHGIQRQQLLGLQHQRLYGPRQGVWLAQRPERICRLVSPSRHGRRAWHCVQPVRRQPSLVSDVPHLLQSFLQRDSAPCTQRSQWLQTGQRRVAAALGRRASFLDGDIQGWRLPLRPRKRSWRQCFIRQHRRVQPEPRQPHETP